jgi:hypothetical protein
VTLANDRSLRRPQVERRRRLRLSRQQLAERIVFADDAGRIAVEFSGGHDAVAEIAWLAARAASEFGKGTTFTLTLPRRISRDTETP